MREKEPFYLLNAGAAVVLLLGEEFGFHWVECGDMPDCDCGHLHLIPPVEYLVHSEFLDESDEAGYLERVEKIRESSGARGAGALTELDLAIELHELLEDRAIYGAAEMRAHLVCALRMILRPSCFTRYPRRIEAGVTAEGLKPKALGPLYTAIHHGICI